MQAGTAADGSTGQYSFLNEDGFLECVARNEFDGVVGRSGGSANVCWKFEPVEEPFVDIQSSTGASSSCGPLS